MESNTGTIRILQVIGTLLTVPSIYLLKIGLTQSQGEWVKTGGILVLLVSTIFLLGRRIKRLGGSRFVEVCAAALASMTITIFILSGNIYRGRHQAALAKCETSLKKLGPLYVENEEIDPELAKIACPASGLPYVLKRSGEDYILYCSGEWHTEGYTKLTADHPRYVSSTKTVTRGPLLQN